mmetsp:Transcript_14344/g.30664  ORF Transcript_14344/g.30664 Transcript_14344/m.30664 type:complete len:220 (+) Transcript_14344:1216-1875(+)
MEFFANSCNVGTQLFHPPMSIHIAIVNEAFHLQGAVVPRSRRDGLLQEKVSNVLVSSTLRLVQHQEYQVKSRKQGGTQPRIFLQGLFVIVNATIRIHHSHDRSPSIELTNDTRLGNGNRLLLHRFVYRRPILFRHASEFVNATYPTICQGERSRLQREFVPARSGARISNGRAGQSGGGGSGSRGEYGTRRQCGREAQELRFTGSGIADEKDVGLYPSS